MQSFGILKRAWADTLIALGLSDFSPIRLLLSAIVSLAAVGLIWWWRGEAEAMTEASDIVLYGLAFFGVAFLPLFLWNLWLAPYRLMYERLGEAVDTKHAPQAEREAETEDKAFRALAPQARESRDKLIGMRESSEQFLTQHIHVNALIAEIGTRLKRLDIPTPDTKASDKLHTVMELWIAYLSILVPLAEAGDIQNARAITFSDGQVNAPISLSGQGSDGPER